MKHVRAARRSVLLALTLLSACAASEPSSQNQAGQVPDGVIGNFLAGRLAMAEGDSTTAANDLLRAVAQNPGNPDLTQQAFIATLDAGRPEAVALARQLPNNQIAHFVLADVDIKAGRWKAAEQRFRDLPRQGLTQLMQPLLVAWAQQGDGRTDTALSTLRPYIDNPRFRGLFALQAALIADIGRRPSEAAKLYRITEGSMAAPNLRLAQILASWQARSGQAGEAQRFLAALPVAAPDLSIVMPGLIANVTTPPVPRAIDGVAETYFTFAALLRSQDANDLSLLMTRLALGLRPDFTAARLLAADVLANQKHLQAALTMLNAVPSSDPVIAVVRLRQAALVDRLGRSEDAMHDLERMARDYPDSPLPYVQLGDILRGKSRFLDAVAAYDKAIAKIQNPQESDWIVFYGRGVAEERAHQWPKAKADFERALQLSPNQPFVLNYLGYSMADRRHNLDDARKMIQAAAERRPNDGAITDSLGWVMLRQGHNQDAVRTLERAVELEPEDATINAHLGDAYQAVGRTVEAGYQWRRALTLNPTPDDAAALQVKLNAEQTSEVVSGK
jgi:tetratricopeptide (TPR) repeat protein